MRSPWPICFLVCCFLACNNGSPTVQTPAPDPQATIDTLATLGNQFSAAYMQGDVAAMMALYTEDGAVFPGNANVIRGRDAVERYWTLPKGRTITHHQMNPIEVRVEGDMAYDFGNYEVSGENNGEAWGPSYGKYVVVWLRGTDGTWRMHLDMWNSRPAPETAE